MNNYFLILACFIFFSSASAEVERRAAIDIGSGATKVAIAEVDTDTHQIVHILHETSFPVPYQAALDKSVDGTFDPGTLSLGLNAFQEINKLVDSYQVKRFVAIATSAFRKAGNAKTFVAQVESEVAIPIRIISQREEGEIAFFSAIATGDYQPEEIVVWDIGTGSMQLTTQNESQELSVYMGEQMGAVAFKFYIMNAIQGKELEETDSPNPLDDDDFYFASRYARAFARHADSLIKQKIQNGLPLIGIGRLFYNSIRPLAAEEGLITRNGLRHFIFSSLNKSDEELDNPFAHVDVSNCILVLGMMKALHIHAIIPVDTTTTKGMLVYPSYW